MEEDNLDTVAVTVVVDKVDSKVVATMIKDHNFQIQVCPSC